MSGRRRTDYAGCLPASGADAENLRGEKRMILLQLSSAQGPDECCLAVKKALDCLTKEAAREKVSLTRLETEPGRLPDTLRSALVSLDGEKA
ncbi:Peptide chain release factor, partial [Salmonella enterica subsp. enterica serovar Alachua str. R6-377]